MGRLLCNLLFRKFIDETKQNLVFCSSFSPVLFMYLCHEERTLFGVDADAGMALSALEAFKPTLAVQWRKLLGADSRGLDGLTGIRMPATAAAMRIPATRREPIVYNMWGALWSGHIEHSMS